VTPLQCIALGGLLASTPYVLNGGLDVEELTRKLNVYQMHILDIVVQLGLFFIAVGSIMLFA
jgi:hypothetical protein